jgi:hypothetical protein
VLRQGSRYEPPCESRLLRAVQQQVDYLGLSAPSVSIYFLVSQKSTRGWQKPRHPTHVWAVFCSFQ